VARLRGCVTSRLLDALSLRSPSGSTPFVDPPWFTPSGRPPCRQEMVHPATTSNSSSQRSEAVSCRQRSGFALPLAAGTKTATARCWGPRGRLIGPPAKDRPKKRGGLARATNAAAVTRPFGPRPGDLSDIARPGGRAASASVRGHRRCPRPPARTTTTPLSAPVGYSAAPNGRLPTPVRGPRRLAPPGPDGAKSPIYAARGPDIQTERFPARTVARFAPPEP